ncbi:MAG: hypothetical protein M3Q58_01185, partial [Bacteroidota bacterium]|nr:hypothetical protein [Bacteroidota bacterium]
HVELNSSVILFFHHSYECLWLNYNIQKLNGTLENYRRFSATAVQWLNKALCFVSSFVVAESLVLRNRQLLVAANR